MPENNTLDPKNTVLHELHESIMFAYSAAAVVFGTLVGN